MKGSDQSISKGGQPLEYRALQPWEERQIEDIWAVSFRTPGELSEEIKDVTHCRGLFDGSRMLAVYELIPYKLWLEGQQIAMGGISGVACPPEHRRNGYVARLMTESIREMHERQMPISALYPFNQEFYRRFGWETVNFRVTHSIPIGQLGGFRRAPGFVKRYQPGEEVPEIPGVYDAYASARRGHIVRPDAQYYQRRIYSKKRAYVAATWHREEGAPAEGYVIYRGEKQNPDEPVLQIRELISLNLDAWRGLWGYIAVHDASHGRVEYATSPNFPLSHLTPVQELVKSTLRPNWMLRIVEMKAAFEGRPWPSIVSGALRVQVRDRLAPWNEGTWRLTFAEGRCEAVRDEAHADVSLDVTTLAQLYASALSPLDAVQTGRLEAPNHKALHLLGALTGGEPWHFYEFF